MWFIGVEVEQETSAPSPKKNLGSAPEVLSRVVGEARDDLTRLNLCQRHKTEQLTCESHRVEDHFVNPRTIPLQPNGIPLIMTWIVTMTN